jgi:hypothetical protein
MFQVDEDLQRLLYDVMGANPLDVYNEAYAACVMFGGRVVQTLRRRWKEHSRI